MGTTLAQQRAAFALEQLENLRCNRDDFKTFSAGLPSLILQNGFGQTLAFLYGKASKPDASDKHYAAMSIILAWLTERGLLADNNAKEAILSISRMEQTAYLRAQKETLAMLEWLKRFANAALFQQGERK